MVARKADETVDEMDDKMVVLSVESMVVQKETE